MSTPSDTVRDLLGWREPTTLAVAGLVFAGALVGSLGVWFAVGLLRRVVRLR